MQEQAQSIVYLIHFDQPYYHARHYLGTTQDLQHRLAQHALGRRAGGARLMEVVTQAGITWRVACIWHGGRELEQQLKGWHNGCRLCPICQAERICEQMFAAVSEEEAEQESWF